MFEERMYLAVVEYSVLFIRLFLNQVAAGFCVLTDFCLLVLSVAKYAFKTSSKIIFLTSPI